MSRGPAPQPPAARAHAATCVCHTLTSASALTSPLRFVPLAGAELYFPLLHTRFEVAQKQSQDHERILQLMQVGGQPV